MINFTNFKKFFSVFISISFCLTILMLFAPQNTHASHVPVKDEDLIDLFEEYKDLFEKYREDFKDYEKLLNNPSEGSIAGSAHLPSDIALANCTTGAEPKVSNKGFGQYKEWWTDRQSTIDNKNEPVWTLTGFKQDDDIMYSRGAASSNTSGKPSETDNSKNAYYFLPQTGELDDAVINQSHSLRCLLQELVEWEKLDLNIQLHTMVKEHFSNAQTYMLNQQLLNTLAAATIAGAQHFQQHTILPGGTPELANSTVYVANLKQNIDNIEQREIEGLTKEISGGGTVGDGTVADLGLPLGTRDYIAEQVKRNLQTKTDFEELQKIFSVCDQKNPENDPNNPDEYKPMVNRSVCTPVVASSILENYGGEKLEQAKENQKLQLSMSGGYLSKENCGDDPYCRTPTVETPGDILGKNLYNSLSTGIRAMEESDTAGEGTSADAQELTLNIMKKGLGDIDVSALANNQQTLAELFNEFEYVLLDYYGIDEGTTNWSRNALVNIWDDIMYAGGSATKASQLQEQLQKLLIEAKLKNKELLTSGDELLLKEEAKKDWRERIKNELVKRNILTEDQVDAILNNEVVATSTKEGFKVFTQLSINGKIETDILGVGSEINILEDGSVTAHITGKGFEVTVDKDGKIKVEITDEILQNEINDGTKTPDEVNEMVWERVDEVFTEDVSSIIEKSVEAGAIEERVLNYDELKTQIARDSVKKRLKGGGIELDDNQIETLLGGGVVTKTTISGLELTVKIISSGKIQTNISGTTTTTDGNTFQFQFDVLEGGSVEADIEGSGLRITVSKGNVTVSVSDELQNKSNEYIKGIIREIIDDVFTQEIKDMVGEDLKTKITEMDSTILSEQLIRTKLKKGIVQLTEHEIQQIFKNGVLGGFVERETKTEKGKYTIRVAVSDAGEIETRISGTTTTTDGNKFQFDVSEDGSVEADIIGTQFRVMVSKDGEITTSILDTKLNIVKLNTLSPEKINELIQQDVDKVLADTEIESIIGKTFEVKVDILKQGDENAGTTILTDDTGIIYITVGGKTSIIIPPTVSDPINNVKDSQLRVIEANGTIKWPPTTGDLAYSKIYNPNTGLNLTVKQDNDNGNSNGFLVNGTLAGTIGIGDKKSFNLTISNNHITRGIIKGDGFIITAGPKISTSIDIGNILFWNNTLKTNVWFQTTTVIEKNGLKIIKITKKNTNNGNYTEENPTFETTNKNAYDDALTACGCSRQELVDNTIKEVFNAKNSTAMSMGYLLPDNTRGVWVRMFREGKIYVIYDTDDLNLTIEQEQVTDAQVLYTEAVQDKLTKE